MSTNKYIVQNNAENASHVTGLELATICCNSFVFTIQGSNSWFMFPIFLDRTFLSMRRCLQLTASTTTIEWQAFRNLPFGSIVIQNKCWTQYRRNREFCNTHYRKQLTGFRHHNLSNISTLKLILTSIFLRLCYEYVLVHKMDASKLGGTK
jgi:hypothetical protein